MPVSGGPSFLSRQQWGGTQALSRLGPSVEQKETKQINSAMAGAMLGLGQGAEGGGIAQGPEWQGLHSAGADGGDSDVKTASARVLRQRGAGCEARGLWSEREGTLGDTSSVSGTSEGLGRSSGWESLAETHGDWS